MRASVKQNAKGVWVARLSLGTDATGKRIQRSKSFPSAGSEYEAQLLADDWAATFISTNGSQSMLLCSLLEEYIQSKEAAGAAINSAAQYRELVRRYIKPYLGNKNVNEITPRDCTMLFVTLSKKGSADGKPLSRNTLRAVYQFLNSAYRFFVSNQICELNPAAVVQKPKSMQPDAKTFQEWDILTLIEYLDKQAQEQPELPDIKAIKDKAYAFGFWLALNMGLRVGEVCGLRWRDVSKTNMTLTISGTVVKQRGKRVLRQDSTKAKRTRNIAITEHQMSLIMTYRAWLKSVMPDLNASSPMVTTDGTYLNPKQLSNAFSNLARKLKLEPGAKFHMLRHTHASLQLASGTDVVTLAERLGHGSSTTTLRFYAHKMAGRDQQAAATFDEVIQRLSE